MNPFPEPLDLTRVKVYPLAARQSLSRLDAILVDPAKAPPPCSIDVTKSVNACAQRILTARKRNASVILMYGAHLIKNGAMSIVNSLVSRGWITHLATNGA